MIPRIMGGMGRSYRRMKYPTIPKMTMNQTSAMSLRRAKAPRRQKEMMKAERMFSGTRISSEKNLAVINPAKIMIRLQISMPTKMV